MIGDIEMQQDGEYYEYSTPRLIVILFASIGILLLLGLLFIFNVF
jgi:hypothetical protein